MKQKLCLFFTVSLLFLIVVSLGTTRDGVVKENVNDIGGVLC